MYGESVCVNSCHETKKGLGMDISLILKQLDDAKRTAQSGTEYWRARDIQPILGYQDWRHFESVIGKAKMACDSTGYDSRHHFVETDKKVSIGSGATRKMMDYFLSRYACYLIAMNGEPQKPEIGAAQTYFTVQTRRQEIEDKLTYEKKRLSLRQRVKDANRHLAGAAKDAGVTNFPEFQDWGYRGLYDLRTHEIRRKKNIPEKHNIMDYAGRLELAANEFRITQTEDRLKRQKLSGQDVASRAHHAVGKEVRAAIIRVGGVMPEELPIEEPINKVQARLKKQLPKPDES